MIWWDRSGLEKAPNLTLTPNLIHGPNLNCCFKGLWSYPSSWNGFVTMRWLTIQKWRTALLVLVARSYRWVFFTPHAYECNRDIWWIHSTETQYPLWNGCTAQGVIPLPNILVFSECMIYVLASASHSVPCHCLPTIRIVIVGFVEMYFKSTDMSTIKLWKATFII